MNPTEVLVAAIRAIEEAGVPDDLRVVAFQRAIDLIAAGIPAVGTPQRGAEMALVLVNGVEEVVDTPLARIAQRLKLDPEIVGEVFHDADGEIEITVPSAKLETGKKGATTQLALLLAAARQGAGLEDFTPFDVIRKVTEDYRRYDQANFSRSINEMSDVFNFRGTSRNRSVKVNRPGWEAAAELVRELGGGSV